MSEPSLYPLLFSPVYKDYIWGGRNLATFGRSLPEGRVAESWEIAAHQDGTTVVANGRWAGMPLTDLQARLGVKLVGTSGTWALERDRFPLLVKLLDAKRRLSVQVHPDNDYAQLHEGNELGKSEMWVVLAAEPDAAIIYGVRAGATPGTFRQALETGELEKQLHTLPVRTGDAICVPAGTLHALLGGLVIAEIQQNSNTTYRVYDWNRLGDDGQPRPLHVEKALDVINFDQVEPGLSPPGESQPWGDGRATMLCRSAVFETQRITLPAGGILQTATTGASLETWGVIAGQATLTGGGREEQLAAVQFALLPAAMGDYQIVAQDNVTLLRTVLPDDERHSDA